MIQGVKNLIARAALKVGHAMSPPVHQRGFDGAKVGRLSGDWSTPSGVSVNAENSPDILTRLRQRSRDLERNSPEARAFFLAIESNVVGPDGLRLAARVKDSSGALSDARGNAIEAAWRRWGAVADASGAMSWPEIQALVMRAVARDGASLVRLIRGAPNRFRFAVQVLDVEVLATEYSRKAKAGALEVIHGVEVDEWGRAVAYHLRAPGGGRQVLSSRELLLVQKIERPGQVHGVPWLAASISALRQLEGFKEASLVQQRTAASAMGFVHKSASGEGWPGAQDPAGGILANFEPGTIYQLPDGVSFSSFSPDGASAGTYGDFVKSVLRSVASGLGVSYNTTLGQDAEGVSYSSLRAFTLYERDNFKVWQAFLARALCAPVFNAWHEMAALAGEVEAGEVEARHCPRGFPWVDPLRDAKANAEHLAAGLVSRRQLAQEMGSDFLETIKEIAADNAAAAAAGVSLSAGEPAIGGEHDDT